jgi:hypothetical protein
MLPEEHEFAHIALYVLRLLELAFIVWALAVAVCILYARQVLALKVKFLNWIIVKHSLSGRISETEAAHKQFRRDLWLLLGLILVVVALFRQLFY